MPDFGKCRACGATMRWVKMESGKKNPLDPAPDPKGNVLLVDGNDGTVRGRALSKLEVAQHYTLPADERAPLFLSHFASCPGAQQFKSPQTRLGV